jgi:hypothetical protein
MPEVAAFRAALAVVGIAVVDDAFIHPEPLAITAGAADGIRHVVVDRLSGDDVTALLGGLAGVVLVLLGVTVLWRTRQRGGSLSGAARSSWQRWRR